MPHFDQRESDFESKGRSALNSNKEFLDAYTAAETALRNAGAESVRAYEEVLEKTSPGDAGRLRMCRAVRNYVVHEGAGFVEATGAMARFLKELAAKAGGADFAPAERACVKLVLSTGDTVRSAAEAMAKKRLGFAPVFDRDGRCVGALDAAALAKLVASGKTSGKLSGAPLSKARVIDARTGATLGDIRSSLCANPSVDAAVVRNGDGAPVGFVGRWC